ncbi:MAG: mercuric reductase [Planctomycetota bacterium]|jgi:pyruvate/2-oxoglutarate dehydrogenase complex dihydrolipoamide dehydrogenase (E3) component
MSDDLHIPPDDEFNQTLVANVHPNDWVNPTPPARYDMVVVGAGTAGLITALGSVRLGKKVALIERHLMGGDCLNVGCVPSKAIIRAAQAAADVKRAGEFGVNVPEGVSVDFDAVMRRLRELRAGISHHDSAQRFSEMGIDVYLGDATFTAPDALEVSGQALRFKKACIATGARAAVPPIPGIKQIDYLTNETVFELTEPPRRLAVFGAGPIGCELAQSFARLGSEVYLIEAMHGILTLEDRDAAEIVQKSLANDGVQLLCCGKNVSVSKTDAGARLTLDSHDNSYNIEVDRVLVAVGRAPNTDGLGLEEAGVKYDAGGVIVDDALRTTNPRIFGAGDICYRYKFTHAADATARIVIKNALLGFLPKSKASKLVVPWVTYTDPEIAHVGAYADELDERGVAYETVNVPMSGVDRAILEGDTEGQLKVHVKKGSGKILGATLVSRHAGESIGELTIAITRGVKLQSLASVIHPYPTQAEVIKRAGDTYFGVWLTGLKDRILHPFGGDKS